MAPLRNGRLVVLFAGATGAFGMLAWGSSQPPRATVLVQSVPDAGADARLPTHGEKKVTSLPFYRAWLMANGHVLLESTSFVHDWDPFGPVPLQETKTSLREHVGLFSETLAANGGRRFLAVSSESTDASNEAIQIELWDAERRSRVGSLGTFLSRSRPMIDFSKDGRRATVLTCVEPKDGWHACDVSVYELDAGTLVHRTTLPLLPTRGTNTVSARLSPMGTYFALSGEDFPTEVYDAASGQRVFRNDDDRHMWIEVFNEHILASTFIDDHRLLTSTKAGGLRLVDLASGKSVTHALPANAPDEHHDFLFAPGRDRVAVHVKLADGRAGLTLFAFDGSPAHDLVLPKEANPDSCDLRWSGPAELIVHPTLSETQTRIDATTGRTTTEPFHEPPPFIDHDGWRWDAPHLVTPGGAKVELPKKLLRGTSSVVGDRLLLSISDRIELVTSDGRAAAMNRVRD